MSVADPQHTQPEEQWFIPGKSRFVGHAIWFFSLLGGFGVTAVLLNFTRWWTLAAAVVGVTGAVTMHGIRVTIHLTYPFCIHCGYNLRGLPDNHRCPECGVCYSLEECRRYRKDPIRVRREYERAQWLEKSAVVNEFLEERRNALKADGRKRSSGI